MNLDILIFDMDGVLIDVSKSYRKAIQHTIQIYLETCLGFQKRRGDWVTNEEISLFKSAGGFNSDWDVTSGFLLYLLSISGFPSLVKRKRFSSIQEIILYLKTKSPIGQRKTLTINRRHLISFLGNVTASGGGLRGIHRVLGSSWEGWVYRMGDLDQENLVERIFQEIYLGRQFASYYDLPRLFYKGEGLYLQEKLLIPKKIISMLRKKVSMGIASGRLRFEAELTLKRFHLLPYFNSVVTLDECMEEEKRIYRSTGKILPRSKPHPYSILRAIREIKIPNPRCGYVGDVVDDILAARAAKKELEMVAIGFLGTPANRKVMKKGFIRVGADLIIQTPEELIRFVS
jgi:HAD superfamily hydrolase (TIGR01548 family)